mgnify:FL=1|tara:strand:- start:3261 stop:3698 length:438 start_codon:yes stop_codon:yes gene_type:complete
MVNDFSKGKIYGIIDRKTNRIYIGSTIQTLNKRMRQHKTDYRMYCNYWFGWFNEDGPMKERNYRASFDILINEDWEMFKICNYPCHTKDQLHKGEEATRLFYEKFKYYEVVNVNKCISKKKYLSNNKCPGNQIKKSNQTKNIISI